MTVFTARFRSRCPACDELIEPGTDARSTGTGGWVHADCGDPEEQAVAAPRPERAPCDRCWMVPSVTGVCGCDP